MSFRFNICRFMVFCSLFMLFSACVSFADVTITVPQVNLPDDELSHNSQFEKWSLRGTLADQNGNNFLLSASFVKIKQPSMPDGHIAIISLAGGDNPPALDYRMDAAAVEISRKHPFALPCELRSEPDTVFSFDSRPAQMADSETGGRELLLKFGDNVFKKIKSPGRDWLDWRYILSLFGEGYAADIEMAPLQPPMLEAGTGRFEILPGSNLNRYSFPRMEARGAITLNNHDYAVRGSIWYDHEYGDITEQCPAEKNVFRINLENGTGILVTSLSFNGENHRIVTVRRENGRMSVVRDLIIEKAAEWKEPDTGRTHTAAWKLALPSLATSIDIRVKAPREACFSSSTGVANHNCLCDVEASVNKEITSGSGFCELSDY